jgi:hypothetical protein
MLDIRVTLKSGAQVSGTCKWAEALTDIPLDVEIVYVNGDSPIHELIVRSSEIAAIEVVGYTH